MTQVTFYSLPADDLDGQQLACQLAADLYGDKIKASVWCKDITQAHAFDELLWQAPIDRFIPHNLKGEGPVNGAPVEVCWLESDVRVRQSVIALSGSTLSEPQRFNHIIDFVPAQEAAKQAARERYKYYQRAGCAMQFAQPPGA
ncbi:DNA polymerase III subunit chi [Alteromonas sediminis]|uniref:DNA polymerase III subunit chi n=1 Tax=Alteromonas sediminis TaxID=2259342 RepID=A0A3N5Z5X3_9ALTE|nr:DNA polymerase III subunit chi [Alteromonas sediminis]RPJ65794.1 DNA polymerase III subunit chi [Alteromonas sediminis]